MDLLSAIDLCDGGAVRLVQGDFERSQEYGDPIKLAERFVAEGAPWLHVVDLDAARTGSPVNRSVVKEIVQHVRVPVQVGGGVRAEEDVEELFSIGARRVVLGTAALEDSGFLAGCARRFEGRVALGLDYRRLPDGGLEAASRGWAHGSGRSVIDVLEECEGLPLGAVVVTAIERDGTLSGPDVDGLREVLDATALRVVASGGVGSKEDLLCLARLRSRWVGGDLGGVVVGKALLDGRVTMREALEACAQSG